MHCVASMQVKAALKAAEADARRAAEDAEEDAQIEDNAPGSISSTSGN